jgi:hypothetical protein
MRITLDIDDDVLVMARNLAESDGITLGEAVSCLARKQAGFFTPKAFRNRFHVVSMQITTPRFDETGMRKPIGRADRVRGTNVRQRPE